MSTTNPSVLVIEDETDTVAALLHQLETSSLELTVAMDLDEAQTKVEKYKFELILVDLRLPKGSAYFGKGGVDFMKALKTGQYSNLNVGTPFVVLTAFVHDIDPADLLSLDGFGGVISKSAPVVEDLILRLHEMCPWLGENLQTRSPDYVVDDFVYFDKASDDGEVIDLHIPSWPYGDAVAVRLDELPDDVRQEVDYNQMPVYLWAKVNIAALEPKFVRPHAFRLDDLDPSAVEGFDLGFNP